MKHYYFKIGSNLIKTAPTNDPISAFTKAIEHLRRKAPTQQISMITFALSLEGVWTEVPGLEGQRELSKTQIANYIMRSGLEHHTLTRM